MSDPRAAMPVCAYDWRAVQANLNHINRHEVKPFPAEIAHDRVPEGFERAAAPAVIKRISDHHESVRVRAMLVAQRAIQDALKYVQYIQAGICPVLVEAMQQDQQLSCRETAAAVFCSILAHSFGVERAVAAGAVATLLQAIHGTPPALRKAAYDALLSGCRHSAFRAAVVRTRLSTKRPAVVHIWQCYLSEASLASENGGQRLMLKPLRLLCSICEMRKSEHVLSELAVVPGLLQQLSDLLQAGQQTECQCISARLLQRLAMRNETKAVAVACGCVQRLVELLRAHEQECELAATAAAALAAISVAVEAKVAFLESCGRSGVDLLLRMLASDSASLKRSVLLLIGNLAEHPALRVLLITAGAVETIEAEGLCDDGPAGMRAAAEAALHQCNFMHHGYTPDLHPTAPAS